MANPEELLDSSRETPVAALEREAPVANPEERLYSSGSRERGTCGKPRGDVRQQWLEGVDPLLDRCRSRWKCHFDLHLDVSSI